MKLAPSIKLIRRVHRSYSNRNLLKSVNPLASFYGFQAHSDAKEKLAAHQKEMMAKGLPKQKPIDGVKNIVLIVSGKGGVGKSTTAVNTAAALADSKKLNVGLLDVDVFGPSVPLMIGLNESPQLTDDNKMIPPIKFGVKCMSLGLLVTEKSAVIWRGLMVMSAIERLLRQVAWEDTDYLIVDTPPGTGDTLLSLIQNIPISDVPLIAKIPLEPTISISCDAGVPVVLSHPNTTQASQYKNIADSVVDFIEKKNVAVNG